MPPLGDPAAKVAMLEPLHSQAAALQQRIAAERRETEEAFRAEEQAQGDAIDETTAPVLELEQEIGQLRRQAKAAEAAVRQMMKDSGVSRRTGSMDRVDSGRRAFLPLGSIHSFSIMATKLIALCVCLCLLVLALFVPPTCPSSPPTPTPPHPHPSLRTDPESGEELPVPAAAVRGRGPKGARQGGPAGRRGGKGAAARATAGHRAAARRRAGRPPQGHRAQNSWAQEEVQGQ